MRDAGSIQCRSPATPVSGSWMATAALEPRHRATSDSLIAPA